MLLGDMGARVIKVERPGAGDDCRAWGPPWLDGESLWFMSVNRNKESVTSIYSNAAGRKVLHDMVAKADVVIVNLVGARAAKARHRLRNVEGDQARSRVRVADGLRAHGRAQRFPMLRPDR